MSENKTPSPHEARYADELADVFTSFAIGLNPNGLSVGIDSAYELADHIANSWLAEHDAKIRAEEREKAAQLAEAARSGNYNHPEDWTPYAHGNNTASDAIAARIRAQKS